MVFDHKVYRNNKDGIGSPGDAPAANSTDDNSLVALAKKMVAQLSGTITVTAPVGSATAANQATEIASLASMDGKLNSINFSTDTLETALGIVTETAPASDTASSGLNGRLQRLAQRLTSLIALVPASLGAKTAAASFSVTTATDDNSVALMGAVNETAPASDTASSGQNGRLQRIAQNITGLVAPIGGVTETAPASDTASSGLNGRLQRIAQRITSLIGLVPASIGQKAMSASFAVTVASDQTTFPVTPGASAATGGISTTARLASAAASTNATLVKGSAGRIYCLTGKNNAAYDVFLVLYDSAASPPVPGTTTIRRKVCCPAGQAFVFDFPVGLTFATGIGYAFTKLVADADTTVLVAADITAFNMDYV